jgi:hypothetical protein
VRFALVRTQLLRETQQEFVPHWPVNPVSASSYEMNCLRQEPDGVLPLSYQSCADQAFASMEDAMHAHSISPGMQQCIDACLHCYRTCRETAMNHCLESGGRHVEPAHFRLMINCSEICRTSAEFMMSASPLHAHVCAACAVVCVACAESCEDIGQMDECAQACRACAQNCRQMASQPNALSSGTHAGGARSGAAH